MTTATPKSIRALLCAALAVAGPDERTRDRYAMAAAIGLLTLWGKDAGWKVDGKDAIPAGQMPPSFHTEEMDDLITWWEILSDSDLATAKEITETLRSSIGTI